jgi:hypothetical protein
MMRLTWVALLALGCSNEQEHPPCPIPGLYSVTTIKESGDCDTVYAGMYDPSTADVYTIEPTAEGMAIKFAGVRGLCMMRTGECSGDVACDAETVTGATGTIQMSLKFVSNGFQGTQTTAVQQGTGANDKHLPACILTEQVTGIRR